LDLDLFISQLFLLAWLGIFYGILYVFNRFIPKGFYIAQILFVVMWGLQGYSDFQLGYLPDRAIPVYWLISSVMLVFSRIRQNSIPKKKEGR